MKKLIKYFGIALLSILAIIILILGALSFKYSPRYVYRLARYHVADVYDYIHFENRVIASGFSDFNEWAEKSQTTALIMIRRDTIVPMIQ